MQVETVAMQSAIGPSTEVGRSVNVIKVNEKWQQFHSFLFKHSSQATRILAIASISARRRRSNHAQ
jgi:hypothetical protein